MRPAPHLPAGNNAPTTSLDMAAPCPICGHAGPIVRELPRWGGWCVCPNCELEFAQPMKLPDQPSTIFDQAYQGQVEECGMEEFAYRLTIRSPHLKDPKLWFFSPFAIDKILAWLKTHVQPGATVLELGCGLGLFLHTLKREGYNPVGLDVAGSTVGVLRNEGFTVWHGTLDTMPDNFVKPHAIVSLFMVHHLDDPMGFFRLVRGKFPSAPVAIAEYGRGKPYTVGHLPPRTLTRWNTKSLATALSLAGYEPFSIGLRSTGSERKLIALLRGIVRRPITRSATMYLFARRIQRRVLPKVMRPFQQDDFTVLAFGTPCPSGEYRRTLAMMDAEGGLENG